MKKTNQDWFEQLINDFLMQILGGLALGYLPDLKDDIEDVLKKGYGLNDDLPSSPLLRVVAVNDDTITFLARGEFGFFGGAVTAFVRFEVTIAKTLIVTGGTLNVDIKEYRTVIGDLTLSKENLFDARLAFGYDKGNWLGRGAFRIVPVSFGLDIFLGGLDDRGAMLGLKVEIPVAIALGSSGLGLKAIGGDFAYNFIAWLTSELGQTISDPNAKDYVRWASNTAVDKWKPGPVDKTAVGVGVKCDLVTMADQGKAIRLIDVGLAVLTPGPIFILGGRGQVLLGVATAEGYLVVDLASPSIAVGLSTTIKLPPKKGSLVDGSGRLEAFFSFEDPSLWYLYLGTPTAPVQVKVLKDLFSASIYYMIDNKLMQFGAEVVAGWDWKWWKIRLVARIGIKVATQIGWNPFLLGGYFKLWGEIGIEIWFIKLYLRAYASAEGTIADPCVLTFAVGFTVDLPWPIPDLEFETDVSFSDEDPKPAVIQMPLAEAPQQGAIKLGAIHPITGRQWLLGTDKVWPDLEIVVPFKCPVIDSTSGGTVVGPVVSSMDQGGYDVRHELTEVTLKNVQTNQLVKVKGVWANMDKARTARLHLLGQTPFDWLTPHITPGQTVTNPANPAGLVFFGQGAAESFSSERRFSEMLIQPKTSADLLTTFSPALPMRVLSCNSFRLRFATSSGAAVQVEEVRLFVITSERSPALVGGVFGDVASTTGLSVQKVQDIYGETYLGMVTLPIGSSVEQVWLESMSNAPLLVYGVFYVEDREFKQTSGPKQTLKPGVYELTAKGKSNASHSSLPDANQVDWSFKQKFEVVYPERLRPYIGYTTMGDSRLFGKEGHAWNPTTYGYGFPHYRGYHGVVRFRVPYLSQIYTGQGITIRLQYDDRSQLPLIVQQTVNPIGNPDKASSAQQVVKDWVAVTNKNVSFVDEEIVFTQALSKPGSARVSFWFKPPNGVEFLLDEWTAHISQFESFQEHLAWNGTWLDTTYDSTGKTVHTPTFVVEKMAPVKKAPVAGGNVVGETGGFTVTGELVAGISDTGVQGEYNSVPSGWEMPASLTRWLKPLDAQTSLRYARFALDSGIRFDAGAGGGVAGPNEVVSKTVVEALVDSVGRPLALWLRTPEPVDWRRVKASLRVRHATFVGNSLTSYSTRTPLDLEIAILSSPDASSAFLVGRFAGQSCTLPRGGYELTLTYDPYQAGLPRLRPGSQVSVPEKAVLTFSQPSGLDWPQPPAQGKLLPGKLPEAKKRVLRVIPELMQKILEGRLLPEEVEVLRTLVAAVRDEAALETLERAAKMVAREGQPLAGTVADELQGLVAELAVVVEALGLLADMEAMQERSPR